MHTPLRNVLWVFRSYHRVTWDITRALKGCWLEDKESKPRGMEGGELDQYGIEDNRTNKRCKGRNSNKGGRDPIIVFIMGLQTVELLLLR